MVVVIPAMTAQEMSSALAVQVDQLDRIEEVGKQNMVKVHLQ